MAQADLSILARGRVLAQNLRQEGRMEDAEVVDELAQYLEKQAGRSPFATTGEVARRLGVSRQTIVNWIKRGYLPGVQLGGRLVVPAAELAHLEELARLMDNVDTERPQHLFIYQNPAHRTQYLPYHPRNAAAIPSVYHNSANQRSRGDRPWSSRRQ